jgi:hydroxypyruvate isomerase
VDHKDYQCDHTSWGVEVVKRVGSPRFKLLYDIYHMQIMEGDVIRTIRDHFDHIAHYHTGGVPGRHELDETQELQYRAIMTALAERKYQGYVGQEFIPSQGRDPLASLQHGFGVCSV